MREEAWLARISEAEQEAEEARMLATVIGLAAVAAFLVWAGVAL